MFFCYVLHVPKELMIFPLVVLVSTPAFWWFFTSSSSIIFPLFLFCGFMSWRFKTQYLLFNPHHLYSALPPHVSLQAKCRWYFSVWVDLFLVSLCHLPFDLAFFSSALFLIPGGISRPTNNDFFPAGAQHREEEKKELI